MARYSVAITKDKLSSLIDKALAGEEVVITRHGKPVAEINMLRHALPTKPERSRAEWMEWLRERREALPTMEMSYLALKRMDEADRQV